MKNQILFTKVDYYLKEKNKGAIGLKKYKLGGKIVKRMCCIKRSSNGLISYLKDKNDEDKKAKSTKR